MSADVRPMGAGEFARAVGATYRQVDYWARHGYLEPALSETFTGTGALRSYSSDQVEAGRVLAELLVLRQDDQSAKARVSEGIRQVVAHVTQHGAAGQVELIPGITVDLERLGSREVAA